MIKKTSYHQIFVKINVLKVLIFLVFKEKNNANGTCMIRVIVFFWICSIKKWCYSYWKRILKLIRGLPSDFVNFKMCILEKELIFSPTIYIYTHEKKAVVCMTHLTHWQRCMSSDRSQSTWNWGFLVWPLIK